MRSKTPAVDKFSALSKALTEHVDERVLIFCEFELTARALAHGLSDRPVFVITGSTPVFDREAILQQFFSAKDGIIIMTSVGAEGLDLQVCAVLINFDLNWNPMVLEQRIGRIDRLGQKKENIFIYNMVVSGSIDERVINTLGRKLKLVTGSFLEPGAIVEASSSSSLFNVEAFEWELRSAEQLLHSLEMSGSEIPGDYVLAEALSEHIPSVNSLVAVAEDNSLVESVQSQQSIKRWIGEFTGDAAKLKEITDFYKM